MTATVIRRAQASQSGKIHYLANASVVDGGAQVFDAYIENDGGTAFVRLCKTSPAGVTVDMPPVRGPENSKVDGVALMQSGRDLHVRMTSHVGDLNTMLSVEVLQGACIPYGASGPQLAQGGAFVPAGGTPTVDPIDYNRIAQIVAGLLGIPATGHTLIGDLRPNVREVVEGLFNGGNGSAIVYQQLRNTSYSGALDAIHAAGADGIPDEPTSDDGS